MYYMYVVGYITPLEQLFFLFHPQDNYLIIVLNSFLGEFRSKCIMVVNSFITIFLNIEYRSKYFYIKNVCFLYFPGSFADHASFVVDDQFQQNLVIFVTSISDLKSLLTLYLGKLLKEVRQSLNIQTTVHTCTCSVRVSKQQIQQRHTNADSLYAFAC